MVPGLGSSAGGAGAADEGGGGGGSDGSGGKSLRGRGGEGGLIWRRREGIEDKGRKARAGGEGDGRGK